MVLKADYVDKDTPGKTAPDWTFTAAAANSLAGQVNTNTSKLAGIEANADVTDSANVDAAGAVMNSDTSTASMSFVVDEDTMTSDSATKVPTQQSVKAYVDATTAAPVGSVFNVDTYGADPTGATFSDTAVAAAVAALGTGPGVIEFGSGTYKLNDTITLAYKHQSLHGQGQGITQLDYRGTGDCIRWWDSVAYGGLGGSISGFLISGDANANTNIVGIHMGDLYAPIISDVVIYGFRTSGSMGLWVENTNLWCERARFNMLVEDCAYCYLFDTRATHPSGFSTIAAYGDAFLSFQAKANQHGIIVKGNSRLFGSRIFAGGNCLPGETNTGVALTVGTTAEDTSQILGQFHLTVETTGSGVGHTDINVGAAASIEGYGALQFDEFDAAWVAGTATKTTVKFFGRIDCPSVGRLATGQVMAATGDISTPQIRDVNGNIILCLSPFAADTDNYAVIRNRATGNPPVFSVDGPDANIPIAFVPKGTSGFYTYAVDAGTTAVPFEASGENAAVGWNFITKGAGTVQSNGNPVGVKVAVPANASSAGLPGQWATDGSAYLYVCTATNTWVRGAVTFATW